MNERETQFHAALLCVGMPDKLKYHLQPDSDMVGFNDRAEFLRHMLELKAWLSNAGYFDVHYEVKCHSHTGVPLTRTTAKADAWISAYYRWCAKQGENNESGG